LLDADHGQPDEVEMLTDPFPPDAPTEAFVGFNPYVQGLAAWLTVNV
jgi:hypothetical protein